MEGHTTGRSIVQEGRPQNRAVCFSPNLGSGSLTFRSKRHGRQKVKTTALYDGLQRWLEDTNHSLLDRGEDRGDETGLGENAEDLREPWERAGGCDTAGHH